MIREELAVPRVKCPSLESFSANYLLPHKPAILEGIVDHWPAFKQHPWRFAHSKSTICMKSFISRRLHIALSVPCHPPIMKPLIIGGRVDELRWRKPASVQTLLAVAAGRRQKLQDVT